MVTSQKPEEIFVQSNSVLTGGPRTLSEMDMSEFSVIDDIEEEGTPEVDTEPVAPSKSDGTSQHLPLGQFVIGASDAEIKDRFAKTSSYLISV